MTKTVQRVIDLIEQRIFCIESIIEDLITNEDRKQIDNKIAIKICKIQIDELKTVLEMIEIDTLK